MDFRQEQETNSQRAETNTQQHSSGQDTEQPHTQQQVPPQDRQAPPQQPYQQPYQQPQQQPYLQPQQPPYRQPKPNSFATVSLVLGIASLVLLCTGVLSIPLGALGIVFAVLSRRGRKLEGTALGGCISSAIGLGTGLLFTAAAYIMIIFSAVNTVMEDPAALSSDPQELTDQIMESIYGEDYKQLFEQYGIDYDEMMENMYDN